MSRALRLAGALLAAQLCGCSGLVYHPDDVVYGKPGAHGVGAEEVWFPSGDGTRLHGWFFKPARKPRGTVIQLHGNAANVTAHAGLVAWLTIEGFQVLSFDYRGYGRSEGSPTREGVQQDALAALAYVRARGDVDPERLLVYGQSLGGAVAVAALAEDRRGVRGLALEGTFDDYVQMGNEVLGGTPLTWPLAWLLMSDDHAPVDAVGALAGLPLLVIHSVRDEVVPYARGRALFEAAPRPKYMLTLRGGKHLRHLQAVERPSVRAHLVGFFDRCLAASAKR